MSEVLAVLGQWGLGALAFFGGAIVFLAVMVFLFAPEAEELRQTAVVILILIGVLVGITYGLYEAGGWVLQVFG